MNRAQRRKAAKKFKTVGAPAIVSAKKGKGYLIEDVWAEDGMVRMLLTDGSTQRMEVKEAVSRAQQLNQMFPKDRTKITKELRPQAERVHKLIEKIGECCRKAQYQKETGDKNTILTHNLINGLTPDGKEIKVDHDLDKRVYETKLKYPTLTDDEILAVLRNPQIDHATAEALFSRYHTVKLAEEQMGGADIIV